VFYVFMLYGPSDIKMLMQFFDILCLRGGNLNAFRYLTVYGEGWGALMENVSMRENFNGRENKNVENLFQFFANHESFFSTLSQIAVVGGNLECFFLFVRSSSLNFTSFSLTLTGFFFLYKFSINEWEQNKLMARGDTCWFWLQFATSYEACVCTIAMYSSCSDITILLKLKWNFFN